MIAYEEMYLLRGDDRSPRLSGSRGKRLALRRPCLLLRRGASACRSEAEAEVAAAREGMRGDILTSAIFRASVDLTATSHGARVARVEKTI